MKYEEWLETVRIEDENRRIVAEQIVRLRKRVKDVIPRKMEEIIDHMEKHDSIVCRCDSCVAFSLITEENPLVFPLVDIALQFLLNNFNGAACNYYYSYLKKEGLT